MLGVRCVLKNCKGCGTSVNPPTGKIWISEEGLCSVCHHEKHKWENLHLYGYCFICTAEIQSPSTNEIHFLWTDAGWHGEPICFGCFDILKGHPKLDVPIKRKEPKKRGLESWIY